MSKIVVDQVLTNIVQGYKIPESVGHLLFPRVNVTKSGGKVVMFTDKDFIVYQTQRSRGANTKRIDIGYEGQPYSLELHSLEGKVPREDLRDADAISPTLKLGVRATNKAMRGIMLPLEVQQATMARDPANYPDTNKTALSGTSQWTDASSDPFGDIETGKDAIRQKTGADANTMVLSPVAFKALKNHPAIIKRLPLPQTARALPPKCLAICLKLNKWWWARR